MIDASMTCGVERRSTVEITERFDMGATRPIVLVACGGTAVNDIRTSSLLGRGVQPGGRSNEPAKPGVPPLRSCSVCRRSTQPANGRVRAAPRAALLSSRSRRPSSPLTERPLGCLDYGGLTAWVERMTHARHDHQLVRPGRFRG